MTAPFLSSEEFDEQAHRFYDAGDYDAALDVLRDGLRVHSDSALLHVGLGYVRMAREEFAWARRSFEEALAADPEYEDAWVGLGETLLKFGREEDALACFARVDELGLGDDLELGLTIGRALYREGLFAEARRRFSAVSQAHGDSSEVAAAHAYTLHALGDDVGARRELRRSLRLDPELHEARIYLAHLLHDRGDRSGALRHLERVPPAEHWDTLSLWRYVELKCAAERRDQADPLFAPWRERIAELEAEPDAIDHLLAEVEAAFEEAEDELPFSGPVPFDADEEDDDPPATLDLTAQVDFIMRMLGGDDPRDDVHRVRTAEGSVYEGTWEEIVTRMRDSSADPSLPLAAFMRRAAKQIRERTGRELPCESPEAFLRAVERIGLLQIES